MVSIEDLKEPMDHLKSNKGIMISFKQAKMF